MPQTIVFSKTISITDAQIKALPTTPFPILPTPGVGKAYQVTSAAFVSRPNVAYSNINTGGRIFLYASGGSGQFTQDMDDSNGGLTSFFTDTNGEFVFVKPFTNELVPGAISDYENRAMVLFFNNSVSGNLTDGDASNTLKITVCYTVIDL